MASEVHTTGKISPAQADTTLYGAVGLRKGDCFTFPGITYKIKGISSHGQRLEVETKDERHSRTLTQILTEQEFQAILDSHAKSTNGKTSDLVATLEKQVAQLTNDMERLRAQNAVYLTQIKTYQKRLADIQERTPQPLEHKIDRAITEADLDKRAHDGWVCVHWQFMDDGRLNVVHRREKPRAAEQPNGKVVEMPKAKEKSA